MLRMEGISVCRLEAVLYSLTAGATELLQLRTPALTDLHSACTAASLACAKPSASSQVHLLFHKMFDV